MEVVSKMQADQQDLAALLNRVVQESLQFFAGLEERPVAAQAKKEAGEALPSDGDGGMQALERFQELYAKKLSASAGPRYLGFVTGGATPASIAGDWLVSVYDQNLSGISDSIAGYVELETIAMLRELFLLPDDFSGAFVSGATMANFVGLAQARQWAARKQGVDVANDGLYQLPPLKIASGAPHSSIYKSLSMLGIGRKSMHLIPCQPNREAIDIAALRAFLEEHRNEPCVVVANAGTVNTVDYDDLAAIARLKSDYAFWLHVDAAFGGFAACSPRFSHLVNGLAHADSITIDAHKWLNVPYDSAMQFTRHKSIQVDVFQNNAAYLGSAIAQPEFAHLTPENSRRFRALPAWFSLQAYGRAGYKEIVESNAEMARLLGEKIAGSDSFELLAPVRLNVVCFSLKKNTRAGEPLTMNDMTRFLGQLSRDGRVFMTPTNYQGRPAIRAAFSNWRTAGQDVDVIWQALCDSIAAYSREE
ncbi:amino acid decarboxylase [Brevibacillus parabrevis]|nr:amino acid decarboxylase [Brevibacillus parabrevis]